MNGNEREPTTTEPAWRRSARDALAAAPDPDRACKLADQVLAAAPPEALEAAAVERPENLPRVLFALCGVAPFFAPFLVRHPDWLVELVTHDLSQPRTREQIDERVAQELDRGGDGEEALRRAKYRELARITVRDTSPEWVPLEHSGQTLEALSQLADSLLSGALRVARDRIERRLGPPEWSIDGGPPRALGFCVLGLGKLGSEELNYSSDVDLVYVFEASGPVDGPQERTPDEYFVRVAQEFGRVVGGVGPEGFLYRIDLELRPGGSEGALVVSDRLLSDYYETWADTWERATFMKARPVAGDLALGWRTIRALSPLIYRSAMDYTAVRGIRELKEKIRQQHGQPGAGFNVKLDAGGIRDVEFVAQALQLLHGGRIVQVRDRSTQRALQSLADVDLLPRDRCDSLLEAYRFLRRVENRLQMAAEHQTHRVPADPAAFERLARSVGFESPAEFQAALDAHRDRVLALFASSVSEDGADRILELFTRNVRELAASPTTRKMLEELAGRIARAIDASPDPERALNNLDRFVAGVGSRRFYYELLLDRPELVPRLTAVFAASAHLSGILANHPRLVESVFDDPERLLLSREELRRDLAELERELGDDYENRLAALRLFRHRQTLNVGLLDIGGHVERAETERALTEVAEVCLEAALALTREADGAPGTAGNGRLLVVGMGKLASFELSYGSDLDLIFLYDADEADPADAAELQHATVRRIQRLISAIQTPTGEGFCYEVDARLRPSGNQGTLVTSFAAFRSYHESSATWERQALLRARPVAGDPVLADAFRRARLEILARPLPDDARAEIRHVRQRMETEIAQETRERRNFKTGRGGVVDIESAVEYLRLRHAAEHPELLDVDRLEIHLERLERSGLLDARTAGVLREGWDFLQALGSRLRVVENRSISDLDDERGDLEGLARRLGYTAGSREGGARRALLLDYERHTDAIRTAFAEIMGGDSADEGAA